MHTVHKIHIPVAVMACAGPNSHQPIKLPEVKVVSAIGRKQGFAALANDVDLLVLTQLADNRSGPGFQAYDEQFNGALSAALDEAQFAGHTDEHILVELPGGPKVAIFGLGKPEEMGRRRICAFFNYVFALSIELNVRSVLIPIFPHRLTAGELNLKGTAAVFNCIMQSWARKPGGLNLEEIHFHCTHQAKVQLEHGLVVTRQLCATCHPPVLG